MSSRLGRVSGWRPGPAGLAVVAAVLIAIDLGARIFTTNDDARFPLLAQDILSRGDWLWPRLNGATYYNKPPLLAWLIALVSWPVGHVTQWTAVVPSAVAAVVTVALVHAMTRDLFGADAGRLAALVVMTTQGLFFHAHLSLPDVLLTCFITASLWMFVRMTQGRPGPWWLGFYGLVGLAFWSKGPAGLLPLAVVLTYALVTRTRRTWSLRLAAGVPLVAGIVGLWVLLGALSDARALSQAVATDHLAWYRPHAPSLTTLTAPVRNLIEALAPWVVLAPLVLVSAARSRRDDEHDRIRLVLVWLIVTAALISLSSQQRLRYYVPIVPPMSMLLGWWFAGPGTVPAPAPMAWLRDDRVRRVFVVMWIGSVLGFVLGYHWELTRNNRAGDYPRLAAQMRPLLADGPVVVAWGVPDLPLAFYVGRPVLHVANERGLRALLAGEPRMIVVASEANWARVATDERLTAVAENQLARRRVILVRSEIEARPPARPSAPEPAGGERGALGESRELGPHDAVGHHL
jgi:4-amino-4-deoxy-L-arabinose transferase-like glycosyltransferase